MNQMTTTPTFAPDRLSADARRQLLVEDQEWIGKPFELLANPRAIQANARHVALMLLDTNVADRASQAAAFMEEFISTFLATQVKEPSACGRGCSHCCTTFVSVTIPEVFNLARSVRNTPSRIVRVMDAAGRAGKIPQHLRENQRIICPILEQHACAEYMNRPMVCRALMSKSLEACLQILVENRPTPMTHVEGTELIRTCMVIIFKAALILAGLPDRYYELNQALAVALVEPDAERRWLAGEPLFSRVPIDAADTGGPSQLTGLTDVLVSVIRPTL